MADEVATPESLLVELTTMWEAFADGLGRVLAEGEMDDRSRRFLQGLARGCHEATVIATRRES